jgi:hypothetical protein
MKAFAIGAGVGLLIIAAAGLVLQFTSGKREEDQQVTQEGAKEKEEGRTGSRDTPDERKREEKRGEANKDKTDRDAGRGTKEQKNDGGLKDDKKDKKDPKPDEEPVRPRPPSPEECKKFELDRLVKQLKGENAPERTQAAKELAARRTDARSVSADLCELTLSRDEAIRILALETLEQVNPELYPHVLTLTVDRNPQKQEAAIRAIGQMAANGKPALPILLSRIDRYRQMDPKPLIIRRENQALEFEVVTAAAIAPDDPAVIKLLVGLARPNRDPAQSSIRESALAAIEEIGKKHSASRKQFVPTLVEILSEPRDESPSGAPLLSTVIRVVGAFGSDARDAVPALKKLKFSPDETIRQAAADSLRMIENSTPRDDTDVRPPMPMSQRLKYLWDWLEIKRLNDGDSSPNDLVNIKLAELPEVPAIRSHCRRMFGVNEVTVNTIDRLVDWLCAEEKLTQDQVFELRLDDVLRILDKKAKK